MHIHYDLEYCLALICSNYFPKPLDTEFTIPVLHQGKR